MEKKQTFIYLKPNLEGHKTSFRVLLWTRSNEHLCVLMFCAEQKCEVSHKPFCFVCFYGSLFKFDHRSLLIIGILAFSQPIDTNVTALVKILT